MYKGKVKKFRDTIHGYIEIPKVIVKEIIDTEQFQRLRYIEQTSMRPLYPAARHDRFIHSLGVYHLGEKAFTYFQRNAQEELKTQNFSQEWWEKQHLLFTLGCLLHDCAHAPFSHTLEALYELRTVRKSKEEASILELDDCLIQICNSDSAFEQDFIDRGEKRISCKGVGAPHEKMSAYCVMHEYKEAIFTIAQELLETNINESDLVYIVRMIIGCQYRKTDVESSIKNCIISMLNSNSIDVDGLDYIVRDAYMSGIDNFSIDYQRLLSSYTIIPVEKTEECVLNENTDISGIWLKGTNIIISNKFQADEICGKLVMEGIPETQRDKIAGRNCKIEGEHTINTTAEQLISVGELSEGEIHLKESCRFKDAHLKGTISGKRIAKDGKHALARTEIEYILAFDKNSLSIIQSTVEARNHEYLWVYTHPKVLYSSNFLQVELLKYSAKYLCCLLNGKIRNDCKLEFSCENCAKSTKKKNSQRKIKDLEEDLILYILGYDAYFDGRVNCITEKMRKKLYERGYIFAKSCDDDLIALFKRIYMENKSNPNGSEAICKEFEEFFARDHRKALWKSFVEYDNILKINQETKQTIQEFCKELFNNTTRIYGGNYAFPGQEYQKIFEKNGMRDVVVIKSSVKTKQLDPYETFIDFPEQIYRLGDLFDKANLKDKLVKDFYYIYADMEESISLKKIGDLAKDIKAYKENEVN